MGLIKWWNDRKAKPTEEVKPVDQPVTKDKPEVTLSNFDRVTNYFASGGEIVDLSNKPRENNDGLDSDYSLMKPWNRAHTGTKDGLAGMVGRKR